MLRVWTNTLVEAFDEETVFEPPLVFDEDSVVTSPMMEAMAEEPPTTIFDPPKSARKRLASGSGLHYHDARVTRPYDAQLEERLVRMDSSMQRLHDEELALSYEAAMRQFL